MSVTCVVSDQNYLLQGVEGAPAAIVLEPAHPGWTARLTQDSGLSVRDSALSRTRAVERLLRQVLDDEKQLAHAMTDVDRALEACPE